MNIYLNIIFILLSIGLTRVYCALARDTRLMDKPNERSLHHIPTIRGGGLIFIALSVLVIPILSQMHQVSATETLVFMTCVVLLASISFLDDLYQLSARLRFMVQSVVAVLVVWFFLPNDMNFIIFSLENRWLLAVMVFLLTMWAINHFNFMDGLDGFCAFQAVFLLAAYSFLFGLSSGAFYGEFCFLLMLGVLSFLLFNFPPAKLFMGDVGSATLGLITFVIALIGQQQYHIPILYWFILNSLFLFDATCTLLRRILNKEKWSTPHKKHAYQRLKRLNIDTRIILFGQIFLNCIFFVLLLLLEKKQINAYFLIGLQLMIISSIYIVTEKKFPMFS